MPTFEIKSPDGAVFQVDGPEGSTEEQALAQVQKAQSGVGVPSARGMQAPSPMMPYMADEAKKGLAGTIALPGMAAEALTPLPVRMIGGLAKEVGKRVFNTPDLPDPYQTASDVMGVKNLPTPTDAYGNKSKANEYLGAIARFAGAGAIPGLGVIGMAERPLIAALVEAGSTLVGAMGSVEGKQIGEKLGPMFGIDKERSGHIGEFIGSLAGPGIVAGAGRGLEKVSGVGQFATDAQKNAAKLMAQKQFRESMEAAPQTPANVAEAEALKAQIPGWKPTLGQETNAPGIVAIEQKMQQANPTALARAAERENTNIGALGQYFENKFPTSELSPITPVKTRYQQLATRMNAQLDATNEHIAALSNIGSADNAAIGSKLRELRDVAQNKAKAVRDYMYQDVYDAANKIGLKTDVKDVQSLIKQIAGDDANAAAIMPSTFNALKDAVAKYKPEAGPQIVLPSGAPARAPNTQIEAPFEALHSMYKRSGEDMIKVQMAGDTGKAYQIGQVRNLLKEKVMSFEGPQYGEVSNKLKAANEFYRTKYQPVFNEGLGGRMSRFNRFGDVTADEDVVRNLIFKRGGQRGMQEFTDIFGADPKALSLLENGVQDMFSRAVVRDGQIKPALVEGFIRDHPQLDQMPGMKQKLTNIDQMNDTLLARQKSLTEQRNMLDKTTVAKIAKTDNPDGVINEALTNRQTMAALTSQAKTADEKQALARAVAESVSRQPDPYSFLVNNAPTLRRELEKLGPGHFDNLLNLANAAKVTSRTRAPLHVPLDRLMDIGEQTAGTSVKGILSRAMNVAKGYMSPEYAAFDLGGRYIFKVKTEEANRIMTEAIYDPAAAKALMELVANPTETSMNSLRNHMFSHGVKVVATTKAQNQ